MNRFRRNELFSEGKVLEIQIESARYRTLMLGETWESINDLMDQYGESAEYYTFEMEAIDDPNEWDHDHDHGIDLVELQERINHYIRKDTRFMKLKDLERISRRMFRKSKRDLDKLRDRYETIDSLLIDSESIGY